MNDRRTPMEAEVQELPGSREAVCPEDYYGTAVRPRTQRSHAGFWICLGLAVIAVCTVSVVAALRNVNVEKGEKGWHIAANLPSETETQEDPVRDLQVSGTESYTPISDQAVGDVRLRISSDTDVLSPAAIYAQVSPAVVCVELDSYYGSTVCTGVIISADGYVLSASEGLSAASSITVRLSDERSFSARRVGEDRTSGVCLLRIDGTDLPTVAFSERTELSVGQSVYCVSNPYGSQIPNVFSEGMLSVCRSVEVNNGAYTLLQSTACPDGVGYGCPILDERGLVLGVTTPIGRRIVSGSDPCFAVSASSLGSIVAGFENPAYGGAAALGLQVADIPEDYLYLYGFPGFVWIEEVDAGSPPDGVLCQYDVITAVDGVEITSAEQFERIIASHQSGDRVKLIIYRSGVYYQIILPVLAY